VAVGRRLAARNWELHGSAAAGFTMAAPGGVLAGPAPGIWVEAVDGVGQALPPGVTGHLRFRGPAISLGLHGATAAEAAAEGLRDGWLMSGDIGAVYPDGTIHLRGRTGELIRRGKVDIYLPEVEAVLRAHPDVKDAAMVPIKSPDGEVMLLSCVVANDKPRPETLARFCTQRIARERMPDQLCYVAEIPRLAGGTVARQFLAQAYAAGVAAGTRSDDQSVRGTGAL
jgi:acyl-CoA synthetase (AMP-forming)/AMP-acid ligase II